MAEQELGHFKGAVFGGFERKSVLDYIEALAAERNGYRSRLEETDALCDQLEAELEAAAQREQALLEREAAWSLEKETVLATSEARRVRVESLDADLQAKAGKLDTATRQLAAARARLNELLGALDGQKRAEAELDILKAKLTQLEVNTARRARTAEDAAADRAGKLLDAAAATVGDLKRDYDELREDVLSTAEHLRRQLTRLDARLGEMDGLLEEPAARIRELEAAVERGRADRERILGE